jgi:hypothetical protein
MVCVLDTLCSSIIMALNRERVNWSLVDELSMCDVGSVAWVERMTYFFELGILVTGTFVSAIGVLRVF